MANTDAGALGVAESTTVAEARSVIRGYWDRRAPAHDRGDWQVNRDPVSFARWQDLYREILGEAPRRVLDVGSGSGEVVFLLRGLGHRAEGLDFAPGMLALARRKAEERGIDATFTEGSAARLPFEDGAFDAVHARMVLWTQCEVEKTLAEWMRVLRPGGTLILVEGRWAPPSWPARARRLLGAGVGRVVGALQGEPAPPPKPLPFHVEVARGMYPQRDLLPYIWGVTRADVEALLAKAGCVGVTSRDIAPIRRLQRAGIPWHRRIALYPLQEASAGWGTRPAR